MRPICDSVNVPGRRLVLAVFLVLFPAFPLVAQPPAGLAEAALADPAFRWEQHDVPGFRVHFTPSSYAMSHRDSLLARLPVALDHARALLDAPELSGPIDLFFLEDRAQMRELIGGRATGFAEWSTRTVLLVTNPEWRAFERHEIMHVVAGQAWGPPAAGTAWLQEGLAQAADGSCGGHPNVDVMFALNQRHGWIPLEVMLTRFREQPDLRAYLQAAALVGHLLERYGPGPLRDLWQHGATPDSTVAGRTLAAIEREWRGQLHPGPIDQDRLDRIESHGCG